MGFGLLSFGVENVTCVLMYGWRMGEGFKCIMGAGRTILTCGWIKWNQSNCMIWNQEIHDWLWNERICGITQQSHKTIHDVNSLFTNVAWHETLMLLFGSSVSSRANDKYRAPFKDSIKSQRKWNGGSSGSDSSTGTARNRYRILSLSFGSCAGVFGMSTKRLCNRTQTSRNLKPFLFGKSCVLFSIFLLHSTCHCSCRLSLSTYYGLYAFFYFYWLYFLL